VPGGQPAPARSGTGVVGRLSSARGAAGIVAAAALALSLAGCASNAGGLSLARRACQHVDTSLSIYRTAEEDPASSAFAGEQARANEQLREALPIAASAAGESSQWQALMATLSESTRLPESDLEPALQAQCAATYGGS
jgi:hypothetical protein